jgi:predicted ATPase
MSIVSNKSVSSPVLIGRQVEVASLQALIAQARQGQGQVVLFGGEAGIGKSRLAAEVKMQAQAQGFLMLQGNCFPTDRSSPIDDFVAVNKAILEDTAALRCTPAGSGANQPLLRHTRQHCTHHRVLRTGEAGEGY